MKYQNNYLCIELDLQNKKINLYEIDVNEKIKNTLTLDLFKINKRTYLLFDKITNMIDLHFNLYEIKKYMMNLNAVYYNIVFTHDHILEIPENNLTINLFKNHFSIYIYKNNKYQNLISIKFTKLNKEILDHTRLINKSINKKMSLEYILELFNEFRFSYYEYIISNIDLIKN